MYCNAQHVPPEVRHETGTDRNQVEKDGSSNPYWKQGIEQAN